MSNFLFFTTWNTGTEDAKNPEIAALMISGQWDSLEDSEKDQYRSTDSKRGLKESSAEYCAKYKNIGTQVAALGSIVTLSFHVKQDNVIKLYLYCNGQCIRFMPEDIRDLLPVMVNMNYGDNKEWINRQIVDGHIEKLRELLVDEPFAYFRQSD